MALRFEGGAYRTPAPPSTREAARRPEKSLVERLRERSLALTLIAAAAGFVAELAPSQAEAQVVTQQTARRLEQSPQEQAQLQEQARQSLEAMTVPTNDITRYVSPAYQAESASRADSTAPAGHRLEVQHRNLTPDHDPVRWLEGSSFYLTLQEGSEGLVVRGSNVNDDGFAPSVRPEDRQDAPLRANGMHRSVLTAYHLDMHQTTIPNAPANASYAAIRYQGERGHANVSGDGATQEEAVMQALRALLMQAGDGHGTLTNAIAGDFRTGESRVLRLARTNAEVGIGNTHIEVTQPVQGQFHATVSATVYAVVVSGGPNEAR